MNTKAQHAQLLLEDMTGQRDAARADIEAGLIREDDFTGELNHLSNVVSRYVHIYSIVEGIRRSGREWSGAWRCSYRISLIQDECVVCMVVLVQG